MTQGDHRLPVLTPLTVARGQDTQTIPARRIHGESPVSDRGEEIHFEEKNRCIGSREIKRGLRNTLTRYKTSFCVKS